MIKIKISVNRQCCVIIIMVIITIVAFLLTITRYSSFSQYHLWVGNGDYHYRIPGIICTDNGVVIAYCEQRKTPDDWSTINIVAKISRDNGKTWSENILIVDGYSKKITVNNPVMIPDGDVIHLLYEVEYGLEKKGGGIYYCKSLDEGFSWSIPVKILVDMKDYNVIATGPGHGISTKDGRLIVPVWMVRKDAGAEMKSHHPAVVAVIFSNNHGETWELGKEIPYGVVKDPNESSIIELSDGTFMLNARNQVDYGYEYKVDENGKTSSEELNEWNGKKYRAISFSTSGIDNWSKMNFDYRLPDPICFGSLCRYDDRVILFSNCNSQKSRELLTVRKSTDDGKSWDKGKIVSKRGGYSDIAVNQDKEIMCLAEYSFTFCNNIYHSIYLYVFDLTWLTE